MKQETVVRTLHTMLATGLYMDPVLSHAYFRHESDPVFQRALSLTEAFHHKYVDFRELSNELDGMLFSPRLLELAMLDVVLSTTFLIAQQARLGGIPHLADLEAAGGRVESFLNRVGTARLYEIYCVVVGHDICMALDFYKGIPEAEFLGASQLHPYPIPLRDILLMLGLAQASFRMKTVESGRQVVLSRLGQKRYQWIRDVMEQSGYAYKRLQMSFGIQFDPVEDWQQMCLTVWPDAHENRRQFVAWAGIPSASQVLEVACGDGSLTFPLADALGRGGRLTATDISKGALERAEHRFRDYIGPCRIEFQRASVEQLPDADASFHACVGASFLHAVDIGVSINEMARVVAPGGCVAVMQALHMELQQPFFREWFEPVFDLSRRHNGSSPHSGLPEAAELRAGFEQADLTDIEVSSLHSRWVFDNPDVVVQHMVRGIHFFQTELVALPWDFRMTMIRELIDRGRDVCRKYPLAERVIDIPVIMIKGRRRVP